jgi:hypothetical protein
MMKKIFILLLFIVSSCGYQPLYKIDNNDDYKIREIEFGGDIKLSKKFYSGLPIKIIKNNNSFDKLVFNSKKNIVETSKNSKGQVVSYRTSITLQISFFDIKNNLIKEKTLTKNFLYNTLDNKFEFREYQNSIEKNLVDQITEDIKIYLSF